MRGSRQQISRLEFLISMRHEVELKLMALCFFADQPLHKGSQMSDEQSICSRSRVRERVGADLARAQDSWCHGSLLDAHALRVE